MGRKAGMVHVGCFNVSLFGKLTAEIMPDVEVVHFVDEGLPSLSGEQFRGLALRRLRWLSFFAEESGAEAVMLTCTAFGRLVDDVKDAVSIPVLSVLEIIVDEAMNLGDSIGILSTHPGTLASAPKMIQEQAALKGKRVEVKTSLCAGAFDALKRGDLAAHDQTVLKHLAELMDEVKVIIMPQPSIERVLEQVPEAARKVPILSSPRLSVRCLKETLESTGQSGQQ